MCCNHQSSNYGNCRALGSLLHYYSERSSRRGSQSVKFGEYIARENQEITLAWQMPSEEEQSVNPGDGGWFAIPVMGSEYQQPTTSQLPFLIALHVSVPSPVALPSYLPTESRYLYNQIYPTTGQFNSTPFSMQPTESWVRSYPYTDVGSAYSTDYADSTQQSMDEDSRNYYRHHGLNLPSLS